MYNVRVYLLNFFYSSVSSYVQEHRKEEKILIKGQLVLHVLYLSEHLIDHQFQTDQVLAHFSGFYVIW